MLSLLCADLIGLDWRRSSARGHQPELGNIRSHPQEPASRSKAYTIHSSNFETVRVGKLGNVQLSPGFAVNARNGGGGVG